MMDDVDMMPMITYPKPLEDMLEAAFDQYRHDVPWANVAQELRMANDEYQADGKPWPTLVEAHAHAAIPYSKATKAPDAMEIGRLNMR